MQLKKIIYSLHPLERKVLLHLGLQKLDEIAKAAKLSEAEAKTGVELLEGRDFSKFEANEEKYVELDKFGILFLKSGMPEYVVLKEVQKKSKKLSELTVDKSIIGSAMGELKKAGLVDIQKKDELELSITKKGEDFINNYKNPLTLFEKPTKVEDLTNEQKKILELFKMRKGFLKETVKKSFTIRLTSKGKEIIKEAKENLKVLDLIDELTPDMLKSGSWKNKEFRHYDINTKTSIPQLGRRHPMLEANKILSEIFVEMDFKEMQGPMVETCFWNMDTMWIPQDHPARDEQDTFYLEHSGEVPKGAMDKVKTMHENGIKHSHTPKGEFSEEISKRCILRTHSTSTSFRYLYDLGKKQAKGEDINGKYFYLAPVFRNEAIDSTHLAEFYQGEGFIIGDNLGLADLMGFIKDYYAKLGVTKIKFKPTFNPYTEPSMEAHYYDEKLGKWYALINSGIFRAETLEPMGIKNKTIIAWGIGASRVAALLSGKDSMRDITGATCDFEWLKTRKTMTRKVVR